MAKPDPHAERDQIQTPTLIGRDEMNLAEFPIALLADRVPKDRKTLYFEDKSGRLTVTGSDAYGLPTAADADVIVALIYLTKIRTEFSDAKVHFSRYELIKLLNWRDDGRSYRRLDESFNRWSGVLLVYDKCWWNNRLKCYTDAKMHIVESVEIVDGDARRKAHLDGRGGPLLSSFTWNRKFLESCQADNLRQLDLDAYFSLGSAISKRLYRFLGKRFYVQGDWTFDLDEIAFDRVGLSRNYEHNAGKIKEKLQPAIDELEAIGFLRPLVREDRYSRIDRGQWTIRLGRRSPALVAPRVPAPPVAEPEPPALVTELIDRGVTKLTAAELVQQHPAEAIAAKLEVFDWLTEKQDKRVEKSPAGYVVKSITNDYAQPKGFVSKAERQRRLEAKQAKDRQAAEDRRRKQREDARERAKKERDTAYWESLTPPQRAELQVRADVEADQLASETGPVKRIVQHIRRNAYIRAMLDDQEQSPAEVEV